MFLSVLHVKLMGKPFRRASLLYTPRHGRSTLFFFLILFQRAACDRKGLTGIREEGDDWN